MIVLDFPKEPYWLALPHGVRVKLRPLTTAIYESALAKARRSVADILKHKADLEDIGGTVDGVPDLSDPDAAAGFSQLVFAQALAVAAITGWEGVYLGDRITAAPLTPEHVSNLMLMHTMAEAFVVQYTRTHEALISEGNASRPSPHGTSRPAGAVPTAMAAPTQASPAPAAT